MDHTCPNCGKSNAENAVFCSSCGASLKTKSMTKKTDDNKLMSVIIVLSIIAALIGFLLFRFVTGMKDRKQMKAFYDTSAAYVDLTQDEDFCDETMPETNIEADTAISSERITDNADELVTHTVENVSGTDNIASDAAEYMISYHTPDHAGVNLRSEPLSSSKLIRLLKEGTLIRRTFQTINEYTFVELYEDGITGWVMSDYLETARSTAAAVPSYRVSFNTPGHAGVNMRYAPSSESDLIAVLKEGTAINVTSITSSGYTYVEVNDTKTEGWIMTDYIIQD